MGKLSMNGTEILTKKENGQTIVSVTTENAEIVVNGVTVWSKYDKPEYQDIPLVLRSFIYGKNDYLESDDEKVTADCWAKGYYTCATFYIPKNKQKKIIIRMDLITSLEELETEYVRNTEKLSDSEADDLMVEFKSLFKAIETSVSSAGYTLSFSHAMDNFMFGWWDIAFNLKDWNEEAFLNIWKDFEQFNNKVKDFLEIYNS